MHPGIRITFEDPETEKKVLMVVTKPVTDEDLQVAVGEFIEKEEFEPTKPTEVVLQFAPRCQVTLAAIVLLQDKFPSATVTPEVLEPSPKRDSLFRQS